MSQAMLAEAVAAVSFLDIGDPSAPRIVGSRCSTCEAVYVGTRLVCGACGARSGINTVALANTGAIHSYTVVYRSFPGVKTPFVAAVVDLDGGGTLKGTLVDVVPDEPPSIPFGLRVRLVTRMTGQQHPDGRPFASYFFVAESAAA